MSHFDAVGVGIDAVRSFTVEEKHTVSHTKTPVLSTPMMISMMESVCRELVQALLPAGVVTVGYEVHVKHKAAALIGAQLQVSSKLLEVEGR